jgi:hypothetical protein
VVAITDEGVRCCCKAKSSSAPAISPAIAGSLVRIICGFPPNRVRSGQNSGKTQVCGTGRGLLSLRTAVA